MQFRIQASINRRPEAEARGIAISAVQVVRRREGPEARLVVVVLVIVEVLID